ncbi:MAG: alkylphosphonate utilization protein [Candidatus Absconditabacterales bacterium]|nr:alkylphosphonate utilization protein [Candidatus Absconditabacterales bacterium]
METKDCNGNVLQTGDTVQAIKDLQVKGSSQVFKKGEAIKKIRLTDDPDFVEVKGVYLRTEFLKKRK